MKKRYKKPNIYAIDVDILDIIKTSDLEDVGADDEGDILFGLSRSRGGKSNGGFDGIGWY